MTTPDPVALAQDLIRCPSVTPEEGGALTLMQSVLEAAGFACHRLKFSEAGTPDVENLYARFGSGSPHLCFAGHSDVVPPGDDAAWSHPPFAGDIVDGILYGRGAVDMKGAIACFTAAALGHLKERGRSAPGSISFLITGDEEGPSINGTAKVLKWLAARGERLDAAILGEPTSVERVGDELKIGRRGSLNIDLLVSGKQGHSAYAHLAENPIPKLARLIDRLSTTRLDAGSAHFEPSSIEATVISVPNRASNVIPSEARAKINIRYNDLWTRDRVEARVREVCAEAAREVGARYALSFESTGDVFLSKGGPLVSTVIEAVAAVTGTAPRLSTGGGTSDARFIHSYCPVVELGLVNKTIHQVDENTPVRDLERMTEIYAMVLKRYFGAAGA
ncbi:MAG TPA: succinyl-diaminopimelate desuccinylase [Hyphomicrobiaceae bacterium]|nr:succinyl-diaminopimelate desuccinylase [Hyphomicrobiaceae bacterium]